MRQFGEAERKEGPAGVIGRKKGRKEGRKEGKKEGKKEGRKESSIWRKK